MREYEDYPHLLFRRHWQVSAEVHYQLGECDGIIRAISLTPILPEHYGALLRLSLTKGAQATTAIEGNTLTEEEIVRIAEGEQLTKSKEYQAIEVKNILDAFNALLQEAFDGHGDHLITPELLRRFHWMIGQNLGEHLDAIPGQFRTDRRFVGRYLSPPPEIVPEMVRRLCDWLRSEFHFQAGQTFSEAVLQAIVTHVYIEWIHPFGDGNGRTGRLVEFYLLLRAGTPDIASHILSNHYNLTRAEYFRHFEHARQSRDLSAFISYAVQGFRDGLLNTLEQIQGSQFEITWRKLVYDKFADRRLTNRVMFNRQRALMLGMPKKLLTIREIMAASPPIEAMYESVTERTARRDLEALLEMGLVLKEGERWQPNVSLLRTHLARRRTTASG